MLKALDNNHTIFRILLFLFNIAASCVFWRSYIVEFQATLKFIFASIILINACIISITSYIRKKERKQTPSKDIIISIAGFYGGFLLSVIFASVF
jgi:hypothetical protein